MYHHVKKLMYSVRVDTPNARFGNMLLEQFGGANGELAAAMQYTIQGWNCVDDIARRDLLLDIGTEELSHLEVVGALIRMHLKCLKTDREAAEGEPLVTIAGGGGVALFDSMGNAWTANYLKVTGELDVDLRSNIAAEARAKIVYERLIDHTDDPGTIDTLQFLVEMLNLADVRKRIDLYFKGDPNSSIQAQAHSCLTNSIILRVPNRRGLPI